MFRLNIAGQIVLASKFFSKKDDADAVGDLLEGFRRVVFIDTPATRWLVVLIETLVEKGVEVIVRDHHDAMDEDVAKGDGRPVDIRAAVMRIREVVGAKATISNRVANPACSSLIELGEFVGEGTVIVCDPDPDGLLGAMKALGVTYPELDVDAAILDGPRAQQKGLSQLGELLAKGMATLPPFDANRPQVSEEAKGKLFADFVATVQGDSDAKARLEKAVEVYEAGVAEAKKLLATAIEPVPGVLMVDVVGWGARFDLGTLVAGMEARSGTKVTVVRKDHGPIAIAEQKAGRVGVQYSLAVVKASQAKINLQELLPAGFVSSPETGIITNTSFLLHVNEKVWAEVVLPALKAQLAS